MIGDYVLEIMIEKKRRGETLLKWFCEEDEWVESYDGSDFSISTRILKAGIFRFSLRIWHCIDIQSSTNKIFPKTYVIWVGSSPPYVGLVRFDFLYKYGYVEYWKNATYRRRHLNMYLISDPLQILTVRRAPHLVQGVVLMWYPSSMIFMSMNRFCGSRRAIFGDVFSR